MTDPVFGELRQEGNYGWWGKQTLDFGGNACSVDILIHRGRSDEITPEQQKAFECFMEKWPAMQEDLFEKIIEFYYENEYYNYGPEDEEELAAWWPEIKTTEALLQAITLETIVVAWDWLQKDKRCIFLLFSRTWGGEDDDDNGIGVKYINEEIDKIGYKDMAF